MIDYYLQLNGKKSGPFTQDALEQMVSGGVISKSTLCSSPGELDWYPVSDLLNVSGPIRRAERSLPPAPIAPSAGSQTGGVPNSTNVPAASTAIGAGKNAAPADQNGCAGCVMLLVGMLVVCFVLGKFLEWLNDSNRSAGSSPSAGHYEKEIRDGVKAYDPNRELTPQDEKMIRAAAEELRRQQAK